jgi:hypothetical protein
MKLAQPERISSGNKLLVLDYTKVQRGLQMKIPNFCEFPTASFGEQSSSKILVTSSVYAGRLSEACPSNRTL